MWSGAGVNRFLDGQRPDPRVVFNRVSNVVDRFMDFDRSLADQQTMCDLSACFVLSTYFLDAFNVTGYLWPTGDRGSGKTRFEFVICEMAYLGMVILAGGSYPTLRDMADHGATLAFDDCETVMDKKRADPDKRSLLLAGNRRGTTVTVKEPDGNRGWKIRYVHAFCPRLFSAIQLPDDVLGSRCITVPLVRSLDERRTNVDPLDHETWPHDHRLLRDNLWALGLANLRQVRKYDRQAAAKARLVGRNLDPWRAILAVALWLQEEHGLSGLFDRMEALSVRYQSERSQLETGDDVRMLVLALQRMLGRRDELDFETSTLVAQMNTLAQEADLCAPGEEFANPRRVGRLLQQHRFNKAKRTAKRRRWRATGDQLTGLAISYGLRVELPGTNDTNVTNDNMAPEAVSSCQECQVPGDMGASTTPSWWTRLASRLLLLRLFQHTPICSVGVCPAQPFPRVSASFSANSPPKTPANSIWRRAVGRTDSFVSAVGAGTRMCSSTGTGGNARVAGIRSR